MKNQIGTESNILIVDDEVELLKTLKYEVDEHFSAVFIAESGKEALEIVSKNRIDCIVTDYKMANMNGLELIKQLRIQYPAIPAILITAVGYDSNLTQAIKDGIFDFLEKPFPISVLVNRMRNALLLPRLENLVLDVIHAEFPDIKTTHLQTVPAAERLKLLSGLEAMVRTRLLAKKGKVAA